MTHEVNAMFLLEGDGITPPGWHGYGWCLLNTIMDFLFIKYIFIPNFLFHHGDTLWVCREGIKL